MAFWLQFRILLWKNFTLRRRQPIRVLVEIVWPLLLFLILAWVKTRGLQKFIHECHFDGKAMPSAGLLPFFQGLVCTANNTCHATVREDEIAGQLQDFNNSLATRLLKDVEIVLGNRTETEELSNLIEDYNNILEIQKVVNDGSSKGGIKVGNLLIHPNQLKETVEKQNINLSPQVIDAILDASVNPREYLQYVTGGDPAGAVNFTLSRIVAALTTFNWTEEAVRSYTCGRVNNLTFIQYENTAEAQMVKQQICNLSREQLTLFISDFRSELKFWKVVAEVSKFAEANTGKPINFDNSTYRRWRSILSDVQALDGLDDLMKDINATYRENMGAGRNQSVNDTLAQLGKIICGEGNIMFSSDNSKLPWEFNKDDDDEESDGDGDGNDYKYDDDASPYCNNLFKRLESQRLSRILWRQLKPLIRGKLPYYPDNEATKEIIKQANATFAELSRLMTIAGDWLARSPELYQILYNGSNVDAARMLFRSCANGVIRVPSSRLKKQCEVYSRWLSNGPESPDTYDWRDSINYTNIYMQELYNFLQCFEYNKFEPHENEEQLVNASLKYIEDNKFWGAVVFDFDENAPVSGKSKVPNHVTYKIRMDTDKVDGTKNYKVLDKYWSPGPRARAQIDLKYITYGFAYIQDMVEHGIIRAITGKDVETGIYVQQFPYPCYIIDTFTMAISRSIPMFMVLAWVYTAAMIVKGIVYEKEKRLKEVMKVMGLGEAVHWLAWFINCFVMMFITIVFLLGVLKFGKVLKYSDPSVILVFMIVFAYATINQCFLISVFFSRANLAAACAGIIYFTLYLPYPLMVQWEELMSVSQKTAGCLLSTVAFGFGCSYVARFEEQGVGIQWHNIGSSPIPDDSFNMLKCILMMFLDANIYFILTWYIEAVFPGQYGVPRPWNFPFTKAYWCGSSGVNKDNLTAADAWSDLEMGRNDPSNFEKEPTRLALGLAIRKLQKIYRRGKKLAVDGLSLNFYEDQITSFLGHNGAGKTTTMSILTGLIPPTGGTAYIYDKDIRSEMDEIRKSLGMCPQYNVLFDILTVEEHLWFYGRLKGMDEDSIQKEMKQMIKDVGLPHKKNELSTNLSGGMKRKLSVAIAFVAGSRCVILDEPTAGVDPYARRAIWDLLLKYRKGRTIILSTHHMDEADVLGDRIAIISEGRLHCCGSSLFLKSRYGSGYYLTVAKMEEVRTDSNSGPQSARTIADIQFTESTDRNMEADRHRGVEGATGGGVCDEGKVTSFIRKFVPNASLVEDVGTELTYQLPQEGALSGEFEQLFLHLDEEMEALGISSYGISDTTLEEVFLKVAEENEEEADKEEKERQQLEMISDSGKYPRPVSRLSFRQKRLGLAGFQNGSVPSTDREDLLNGSLDDTDSVTSVPISEIMECNGAGSYKIKPGLGMIRREFMALFIKRFHHVRRSKKGFIAEIILPAVFVLLAMIFALVVPPFAEDPPMEVHPWRMKAEENNLFMFYSNDNPGDATADKYEELLLSKVGLGTRCMDPDVYSIDGFPCKPPKNADSERWTTTVQMTGNLSVDSPACSCETGYQQCPAGAGGPEPSKRIHDNTDTIYNMTGRNITDWLAKTMEKYIKKRYGGYSFGERNAIKIVNSSTTYDVLNRISTAANNGKPVMNGSDDFWDTLDKFIDGLEIENNAKVWFNNKGWIAMIGYMNGMNNMILRANLPGGMDPSQYGITLIQHPMNLTKSQLQDETALQGAIDVLISICVIFAMSFIPASFVLYLIDERISNSKHLQFVSGVSPSIYWISNICWDLMNYLVPATLCIFIFLAFNKQAYVSAANAPVLVCLLFMYGWAIIPMMYPASYVFTVPSSAFVALSCINIFLGITSTIATFILELLYEDADLADINGVLKQVFLCLPQYCLGRGLIDLARNQLFADAFARFGEETFQDPFNWDLVGRNLFAMFIQGIIFFVFTLLLEYNFFCKPRKIKSQKQCLGDDDDVIRERERVLSGRASDDVLQLENLTKVFKTRKGKYTAVDHLCIGVPKGQCFGLLGVNGAGKTTTFKMLTGDIPVTEGSAQVAGYSILQDMTSVHKNLGYCPQFDALDGLLTGREHLTFYARLRGVPEEDISTVAEWAIRKLNLVQHADKSAGDYSGGNKRKLSTAIALIGNPPVIFLDEPTTGMDPKARRFLWNCIGRIIKDGRSVILTSHSMEECEALCNRIAIMVNGKFKCLGSVQHLKNKYGDGYTIIIRVSGHNPDMSPLLEYISGVFPCAIQKELHHNMVQYQIPSDDVSLARIFEKIKVVREELNIEDYSVSQTTLDQVFINFAKLQTDLLDDEEAAEASVTMNGAHRQRRRNDTTGNNQMDQTKLGFTNVLYDNRTESTPSLNNGTMGAWSGNLLLRDNAESMTGSSLNLIRPDSEQDIHHPPSPSLVTPVDADV